MARAGGSTRPRAKVARTCWCPSHVLTTRPPSTRTGCKFLDSRMVLASAHSLFMLVLPSLVAAKKEMVDTDGRPLSPAEIAHKRHFFRIGDGFEGTASDWTEYIVWVIGVIGVFYYMANPNARRNLHAEYEDEDEPDYQHEPSDQRDGDEIFAEAPSDDRPDESPTRHRKTD